MGWVTMLGSIWAKGEGAVGSIPFEKKTSTEPLGSFNSSKSVEK
jgi:hypothetical protein